MFEAFRPAVALSWTCLPVVDILNEAEMRRGDASTKLRERFQFASDCRLLLCQAEAHGSALQGYHEVILGQTKYRHA
jgi:hypothetical protein